MRTVKFGVKLRVTRPNRDVLSRHCYDAAVRNYGKFAIGAVKIVDRFERFKLPSKTYNDSVYNPGTIR